MMLEACRQSEFARRVAALGTLMMVVQQQNYADQTRWSCFIRITYFRQWAVTPCCWEGNRMSGTALAMLYRLQWSTHLRDQGPSKAAKHPAYAPMEYGTLWLILVGL